MSEGKTRLVVPARSDGRCEVCQVNRVQSLHHRKKRGQGGNWDPSNILGVCGDGTRGCHGRIEAEPLWAAAYGYHVKPWEDPATVPVLIYNPNWLVSWLLLLDDGCVAWADPPDWYGVVDPLTGEAVLPR